MTLSRLLSEEYEASFPPIRGDTEALRSGRMRKARLSLEHPSDTPEIIGVLPYLIHPPSVMSSDASWKFFRDGTLRSMIQSRPDDPNLPNFFKQVELILAWRAPVPPEDRFWKADRDTSP